MTPTVPAPTAATIATAWRHITTVTLAQTTPEERWRCMLDPAVMALMMQVDQTAQTGDVLATQAQCQVWHKAYKAALRQVRQEGRG